MEFEQNCANHCPKRLKTTQYKPIQYVAALTVQQMVKITSSDKCTRNSLSLPVTSNNSLYFVTEFKDFYFCINLHQLALNRRQIEFDNTSLRSTINKQASPAMKCFLWASCPHG